MMRPAIGTMASRVLVMVMNLLVIMLAGHRLGAEGLGQISLIVLGITFILLLNNVVGGGALVYLASRFPLPRIVGAAYGWAVLTALVAYAVLQVLPLVPAELVVHVVLLALIQSLYTVHFGLLLGQQRIGLYNGIAVVQALVLLVVFAAQAQGGQADLQAYVRASYAAFGSSLVLSALALVRKGAGTPRQAAEGSLWSAIFRQGGLIQVANFLQLLNYRLAYYLVEAFRGTAALGIYSVANQLAESAWVAPKSLGTVLYAQVSNSRDARQQRDHTLTVAKASVAFSGAVVLVALLLPEPLYQALFGAEVEGIPGLVLLLGPGIMAMAASQAFSHYFSGTGRNVHNAVGSGLGLVVTLLAGYLLIPRWGAEGAAITATFAYGANVLYQAVVFVRITDTGLRQLWFTRADAERLQRAWRAVRGGQ